jgi:hypothetical protein
MGTKLIPGKGNAENPGAGTYNPDWSITKQTPPRFSVGGKIPMNNTHSNFAPGPGKYDSGFKNKR